jgi:hypothetical protein
MHDKPSPSVITLGQMFSATVKETNKIFKNLIYCDFATTILCPEFCPEKVQL